MRITTENAQGLFGIALDGRREMLDRLGEVWRNADAIGRHRGRRPPDGLSRNKRLPEDILKAATLAPLGKIGQAAVNLAHHGRIAEHIERFS